MVAPVFLFADSQLLFYRLRDGTPFLGGVHAAAGRAVTRAAYLGASNGDDVAFFELFSAAMQAIDVPHVRHIRATPQGEDRAFLASAELLLLAGGDPVRGLLAFDARGLRQPIIDAYRRGAVVVGVSAGAVQLGLGIAGDSSGAACFELLPILIEAHKEPDWSQLRATLSAERPRGLGIPTGGGAIYHSDGTLEAVRRSLIEIRHTSIERSELLLVPARGEQY